MNRNELVSAVAESAGFTKKRADEAVAAVFEAISEALKEGGEVRLAGFGSFGVKERAARTARNPRTGAEVPVPASKAPSFKAGKGLKDAVAG